MFVFSPRRLSKNIKNTACNRSSQITREGWDGAVALTSQCFRPQVADSALMNADTSKHAKYTHNQCCSK